MLFHTHAGTCHKDRGMTPGDAGGGTMPGAQAAEAVAEIWGDTAAARSRGPVHLGWQDSWLVLHECVHPRLHGNPDDGWLAGLVKRLGIPASGHWLSLGCGSAGTEIEAARQGMFQSMLALDLAERAIEEARRSAAAQGIDRIEFG